MPDHIADLQRWIVQTDLHAAVLALVGLDEDEPITARQRLMLRAYSHINIARRAEVLAWELRGGTP